MESIQRELQDSSRSNTVANVPSLKYPNKTIRFTAGFSRIQRELQDSSSFNTVANVPSLMYPDSSLGNTG
jgi:hypothetical protein